MVKKKKLLIIFVLGVSLLTASIYAVSRFREKKAGDICKTKPDFEKLLKDYGDNLPVVKLSTDPFPRKDPNEDIWICPDNSKAIVCEYPQPLNYRKEETDYPMDSAVILITTYHCPKMNTWWYVTHTGMGGIIFGSFKGKPR